MPLPWTALFVPKWSVTREADVDDRGSVLFSLREAHPEFQSPGESTSITRLRTVAPSHRFLLSFSSKIPFLHPKIFSAYADASATLKSFFS